ncbi:MAG: hypothetical protein ACLTXU_24115 [Enterocloster bolteae]
MRIRKAPAFSDQGLVGVGQNVTCSLPGYKYQIAPLARGYTCAVADCTFILAKGVFLSAVSTIVFFGTTRPASGFRYTKPPRPVPAGRAAAWYQNCIRNNTQGSVWMGTDSGFYVALRNRPLEGYFASAARENHQ